MVTVIVLVIVIILTMSKFGFKVKGLIKLIVGIVKHAK
jgi:hypothetical protein